MSNGTNKPWWLPEGQTTDLSSTQDFGQAGTGHGSILQPFNPRALYQTPTNQAGPMGMINTNPVGNIYGDNPFTGNNWVNPGNLFTPQTMPRLEGYSSAPIPGSLQNITPPAATGEPGGGVSWMQRQGMNLQDMFSNFGDSRFAQNMQSPQAMAGVAQGIGGIMQGLIGRTARRNAQIAAQDDYDNLRQQYLDLDTSNLYAGVVNKYRDMENTYEDLTVNQQQALFERQMFEQQQANIMQNLAGAAGGSGIAGLAQAMANQGQMQAQRASATIGLQESRINMMRAQEASRLQQLERAGEAQAEQMRLAGAERARSLDWQKTGTLFGMSQQELAAANQAIAQSDAALYGGIGSLVGTGLTAAAMSDRKLKKNIHLIGRSPSGLNIYSFEYIDSKYGDGIFQGVMADEIPLDAVVDSGKGYNMVNYSMIDVDFKKIN